MRLILNLKYKYFILKWLVFFYHFSNKYTTKSKFVVCNDLPKKLKY